MLVGATLTHATEQQAAGAVAGILAANDVTARDLQRSDSQWTRAKGFDTFCAVGEPHAPPADLSTLSVRTTVNGQEKQHGSAADMIFTIPAVLAYISRVMTLTRRPGAHRHPRRRRDPWSRRRIQIDVPGFSSVRNPVRMHN